VVVRVVVVVVVVVVLVAYYKEILSLPTEPVTLFKLVEAVLHHLAVSQD
jgi:hypothetical protein